MSRILESKRKRKELTRKPWSAGWHARSMHFEPLEERRLLTTLTVITTNDSGLGSLRQAILDTNATVGADTIQFAIPASDPNFVDVDSALAGGDAAADAFVIRPLSPLPALNDATGSTIIDGRTQANLTGNSNSFGPEIVLDGSLAGAGADGLQLSSNDNQVLGLNIQLFGNRGIVINAARNNWVAGNYIGTDATGTLDRGNGNNPGSTAGTFGQNGVQIRGGGQFNVIGTDGDGTADASERNIISGNEFVGVMIIGLGSDHNRVAGNFIGTDANGTVALGNTGNGVRIREGAKSNVIGTDGSGSHDAAERNIISGNTAHGLIIIGAGTEDNVVAGNFIGTDVSGTLPRPNGQTGIAILGANLNRVGTNSDNVSDDIERNIISGNNGGSGVSIAASNFGLAGEALATPTGNIVAGNYIGTTVGGTAPLPNGGGVGISGGRLNTVRRNVISGNAGSGVSINSVNVPGNTPLLTMSTENVVAGNFIGTDATGTLALPNSSNGVDVRGVSNIIGTNGDDVDDTAERNVISGNAQVGVIVQRSGAMTASGVFSTQNVVAGNFIGTNAAGTAALPNGITGVSLIEANQNRVGTDGNGIGDTAERNVIAGNASNAGVGLVNSDENLVAGNYIGTDVTGTNPLGNLGGVGIVDGSDNNIIGSAGALANLIAFNTQLGVWVANSTGAPSPTGNQIRGNSIHSNAGLGIDLGGSYNPSTFGGFGDGVTLNDPGDGDVGPNNRQNFPTLGSVTIGASTQITGQLNSLADTQFMLDFYANATGDPSGHGEGERYLGSALITTDSSGNVNFDITLGSATSSGDIITATATDPGGNTSEFGRFDHWPSVVNPIADVAVNEDAADTLVNLAGVFDDVDIATNADALTLTLTGNTDPSLVTALLVGNSLTLQYAANQNGAAQITVRATDLAGAFVEDTFNVTVSPSAEVVIVGTSGDDIFTLTPGANAGDIVVVLNGTTVGTINPASSVRIAGGDGNDKMIINGNNAANAFEIHADRITLNGIAFYDEQVEYREINAKGSGDITTVYDGSATVNGGSGSDTLASAVSANSNWHITSQNSGNLNGLVFFTSTENLIGSWVRDEFHLSDGIGVGGQIDGGGGDDILDYSAFTSPVSVNLQSGSATKTGGIVGIVLIVGGQNVDTLTGPNSANEWTLSLSNTGEINSATYYTSFENLTGGNQSDVFYFTSGAVVGGDLHGGGGVDSVEYITGDAFTVNLQSRTASQLGGTFASVEQFVFGWGAGDTVIGPDVLANWTLTDNNKVSVGGVSFERVENLVGGAGVDTLRGPNQANVWYSTGADAGHTLGMSWQGVEKLTGGNQADTFQFGSGASLSDSLQGGGGVDAVDYSSFSGSVFVDLATVSASGITNFASIAKFIGSSDNDTLVGANNNNSWTFTATGGSVDGVAFDDFENWQGGSGTDTLHGEDLASTWTINGINSGSVYAINFSNIENLTGGNQIDTFLFQSDGQAGTIQGGSGADVIDYSALPGPVTVNLKTSSATRLASFASITDFIGSGGTDVMVGTDNNNVWTITGSTLGTVDSTSFSGFETLQGGTAIDTFNVAEGVSFSGTADGGAGADKLDYSNYVSAVQVNLAAGTATGLAGISGIENVTGGDANDMLIGDNNDNVISGGNGDDMILAGGGNDTLNGGNGRDLLAGGSGADLIHGNATEDILIGGIIAYANESTHAVDLSALNAIMAEWSRTDLAYSARIAHLNGSVGGGLNGSQLLNATTVFDDGSIDALWGDAGLDWFLAGPDDELHRTATETVTNT